MQTAATEGAVTTSSTSSSGSSSSLRTRYEPCHISGFRQYYVVNTTVHKVYNLGIQQIEQHQYFLDTLLPAVGQELDQLQKQPQLEEEHQQQRQVDLVPRRPSNDYW